MRNLIDYHGSRSGNDLSCIHVAAPLTWCCSRLFDPQCFGSQPHGQDAPDVSVHGSRTHYHDAVKNSAKYRFFDRVLDNRALELVASLFPSTLLFSDARTYLSRLATTRQGIHTLRRRLSVFARGTA